MKSKKQEIILSQESVSLDEFKIMVKDNIFPLCVYLEEDEKREFEKNGNITNVPLVNELYPIVNFKKYLFLDGYILREKIEAGEVYVNRFLDDSKMVKNVRFIAPSFGHDLDCPKVVFRKKTRLFFKKMDHFSIGSKYEGEEILGLCITAAGNDEQKRLVNSIKKR